MENEIAGLNLWRVFVRYDYTGSREFWITTPNNSIKAATAKVSAFLRANRDYYPRPEIVFVKNEGVIDA